MKKFKAKIKELALALVAATMIISSVPLQAMAEEGAADYVPPRGTIGSMQDLFEEEAKVQLIMYALRHCIAAGVRNGRLDDGLSWGDIQSSGNNGIFDLGDDMTIDIGYWLEDQLNAGDDGRAYCREGDIVGLAASYLGVAEQDILCGENGKGGIVMIKKGHPCGTDESYAYVRNGNPACYHNSGFGGYTLPKYNTDPDCGEARWGSGWETDMSIPWNKHLNDLYNKIAEEKDWEYRYADLDYYHGMVGYFLYRVEISNNCGGFDVSTTKPSDMSMTLIDITQDGDSTAKMQYKTFTYDGSFNHEFVSRSDIGTCSEMIARANNPDVQGVYLERMKAVLNTKCKADVDEKIEMIKANSEAGVSAETQAAYDNAVNDKSKFNIGMFIEGDETKGWVCKDIGVIAGATPSDPVGADPGVGMVQQDCYNNAGSLGWIVCPLITTGAEMVQSTYEGMIVPFLKIDPKLFNNGGAKNGTYQAWDIFKNFANIAFVILFLVVIMSQLTGFGIDNYGIKKILPKLVVAAILINCSYFICQLAIDVANIVGGSVGGLFSTIGNKIVVSTPAACTVNGVNQCASSASGAGGFIALVVIVVAITAAAVLAIGPQILIPVLLGILSFVVAVFFLFVILGIRQALAVLLVAISPLAFVCYMLPNTKTLFTKWLNTFKGVLIAYPVCSAMVYGGDMTAKIILAAYGSNVQDFTSMTPVLSAGIISIAPIFLIPNVIRKSMGALGMLSQRLQGRLNTGARGKANERLQNSFLTNRKNYRDQARADRRAARTSEYNAKRAERSLYGITGKGGLAKKAREGKLSAYQQRRYNSGLSMVNARDKMASDAMISGYQAMGGDKNISSNIEEAARNGTLTVDQLSAAISAAHDEKTANSLIGTVCGTAKGREMYNKLMSGADAKDVADRKKLADALASRQNNMIAKGMSKCVMDGMSYESMMNDADGKGLRARVQGMGTSAMGSQDKDVFSVENAHLFDADQLAAGIGAGLSGDTARNFNEMLGSAGVNKGSVMNALTTEQLANISSENITALGGAAAVQTGVGTRINDLNNNAELRSKMQGAAATDLNVRSTAPVVSSDIYTDSSGATVQINFTSDGRAFNANSGTEIPTGTLSQYKKKT